MEKKQKVGVYICHCGGNISDYVDVEQISRIVGDDHEVEISKDVMFACADSNQKEMVKDITEKGLDAIVVASCSPKLHLHTFRNVAQRGGLNPYNYIQVNIREQCSWPHSDHPEEATLKAIGLIRGGINRISRSESLETMEIDAEKTSLVIGAGVSGMRAAVELARMGNQVYLIEKNESAGGKINDLGSLFISGQSGKEIVERLVSEIKSNPKITLFTNTTVDKVSGSVGNFAVSLSAGTEKKETINIQVSSVLVASGFDSYIPSEGEFGYGTSEKVITLPEFRKIINQNEGKNELSVSGRKIRSVSFIYCVGSRQTAGENKYCSRVCCTTTVHTSKLLHEKFSGIKCYHYFRDMRTYGKQEILYENASRNGDIFMRFDEKNPPVIDVNGVKPVIKVADLLTRKIEIEAETDLVVLVTGMVPGKDSSDLAEKFKIPVGNDKFFNEIHPKLRPVETVINGVYLGGSCQGPKNITESVQSAMSAAAKMNSLTVNGKIKLDPIVAIVDSEICVYCDKCASVCEYMSVSGSEINGKTVAVINKVTCKGCGICAPVCPENAINIAGYKDDQIMSMIDGFAAQYEISGAGKQGSGQSSEAEILMKDMPEIWRKIRTVLSESPKTIPEISSVLDLRKETVTWHLMTMNRYSLVEAGEMDDRDEYYYYKVKN